MKYKFCAGDYIETKDNKSGYITIFIQNPDGENTIFVNYKDGTIVGYKFPEDEPPRLFKRIGPYDFTKKDEGKIEPIYDDPADWEDSFVLNKINELVDAVNRLEKKVNEMA